MGPERGDPRKAAPERQKTREDESLEEVEGLFVRKKQCEKGERRSRDRKALLLGLGFKLVSIETAMIPVIPIKKTTGIIIKKDSFKLLFKTMLLNFTFLRLGKNLLLVLLLA